MAVDVPHITISYPIMMRPAHKFLGAEVLVPILPPPPPLPSPLLPADLALDLSSFLDVTHVLELRLRLAGEGGMEESGVADEEAEDEDGDVLSLRLQCAQRNKLNPHPRQLAQIVSLLWVSYVYSIAEVSYLGALPAQFRQVSTVRPRMQDR